MSNSPLKIIKSTENLLNKIVAFFSGLFITAIIFLMILKVFNGLGVFIALIIGFSLNFLLKKISSKQPLINSFNNGILTFNIITTVIGLIVYFFIALYKI